MKYQSSKYNTILKHNESTYVYNSLSGALGRLNNAKTGELLERGDISSIDKAVLETLMQNKFIIKTNINEKAKIKYNIIDCKGAKRKLSVSICPTYACNLACTYCFENDWDNKARVLTANEWQTLQAHLESQVLSKKYDAVRVTWSGGEPLIAADCLFKTNRALNKIAKNVNTKYFSSIASNTILASTETFSELVSSGIDSVQITLDGGEKLHNTRRTNADKDKTYAQTIVNIKILREISKNIDILIRIHVSGESFVSIKDAVADLEEAGLRNKVSIGFSRLQEVEDSLSVKEYSELEVMMYRMLMNRKWNISSTILRKLKPRRVGCAAYTSNCYNIDPKLKVYKCWELAYEPQYSCGEIDSSGEIQLNGVEDIAHSYDPFDVKKCRSCMQLPLCMGGCAKAAIATGETTEKVDDDLVLCHSIKYNMKEMINLYLESSAKENAV